MSSGLVVVAPTVVTHASVLPAIGAVFTGVVTVAAVAALVVVGVAAAVLITRAALKGSRSVAGGLARLADGLKAAERRQLSAEQAACEAEARWQDAAEAVVHLNSRIEVLRANARRLGVGPDLPIPPTLPLSGSLAQMLDRCRSAEVAVERAEAELRHRTAALALAGLDASLPASAGAEARRWAAWRSAAAAAEQAAQPAGPAARQPVSLPPDPASRPRQRLQAQPSPAQRVETWLRLLDPDVDADGYQQVLATAAQATTATPADQYLDQLGRTVQRLNAQAARSREDVAAASVYLQGLAAGPPEPGDPAAGAAREVERVLREIVAGSAELTESIRAEADAELRRARDRAAHRNLLASLGAVLRERGFDVRTGLDQVGAAGGILVSAGPGADHSARVLVDSTGIRFVALARGEAADDNQRRTDADWCAGIARVLVEAQAALAGDGRPVGLVEESHHVQVVPGVRRGTGLPPAAGERRQRTLGDAR